LGGAILGTCRRAQRGFLALEAPIRTVLALRGKAGRQTPEIVGKWPPTLEFQHIRRRSLRGGGLLGPGHLATQQERGQNKGDRQTDGTAAAGAFRDLDVHGSEGTIIAGE
jgi:hypothetical protein